MKAKPISPAVAWISLAVGACWFWTGCVDTSGASAKNAANQPKILEVPTTPQPTAVASSSTVSPTPATPAVARAPAPQPMVAPTPVAPVPNSGPAPPPSGGAKFSAAELEKLAAPIALYPDPLLAIVLTASTYPLEVVQAARFVKDTNNIPKIDQQPWDDKVKEAARFPSVIAMMDADLNWTSKLGQAYIEQPMDLMNALQALRSKAQAAGTLKTTPQQVVAVTNAVVERTYQGEIVYVTNTVIQVQPASSQVVYVPSYNPSVVYVEDDDDEEAAAAVISFGVGMAFGAAMWGDCDWHYGGCYWGGYPPYPPPYPPPYYPPPGARPPSNRPPPGERPPGERPGNRPPGGERPGGGPSVSTRPAQRWQPDQGRLSSAGSPGVSTREARGWGGGSTPRIGTTPSTGIAGSRPSGGDLGARPSTGASSGKFATASPAASQRSYSRPSSSSSWSSSSGNSAFGGVSSGSSSRDYSSRGSASRSGGFSGSRGGFGGRGGRGR